MCAASRLLAHEEANEDDIGEPVGRKKGRPVGITI